MDYALILFIIVIAVSAFRGYRSGALVIGTRILSLALAYAAAIVFTDKVEGWLQGISPLQGMLSYLSAGTLVFIASGLVFTSIFSLASKVLFASNKDISQGSAIAGAALGGVVGCFVGILAVWFFTTFQSVLSIKKGEVAEPNSAFQKTAQNLTGKAFQGIVDSGITDSELAVGAVKLLSNPAKNIQHYNQLNKSGELSQFFQNGQVQIALDNRNPAALMSTGAFERLASNQDFDELASLLNLSDDKQQRNQILATKVTKMWAQIQQVQNNPRYQEIINDPAISQSLNQGKLLNLLNNKNITELLSIISSTKVDEVVFDESQLKGNQQSEANKLKKPQKVYRRVDKNGKVHYSDKKIEDKN